MASLHLDSPVPGPSLPNRGRKWLGCVAGSVNGLRPQDKTWAISRASNLDSPKMCLKPVVVFCIPELRLLKTQIAITAPRWNWWELRRAEVGVVSQELRNCYRLNEWQKDCPGSQSDGTTVTQGSRRLRQEVPKFTSLQTLDQSEQFSETLSSSLKLKSREE